MHPLYRSIVGVLIMALMLASCAHRPERYYFGSYSEGERLYSKGDYKKAIAHYQAYINENPDGNLAVISHYYMGKSYLALGQPEEAKKIFERILEKYPDAVWANFAQNQLKELELHSQNKPSSV